MTALLEQTADGIDKLARTMGRADDGRMQLQSSMTEIAEAIATLADKTGSAETHETANARALAAAIEKLATREQAPPPPPALDDASKGHIRNMDVGIKRLMEEQARANELLIDELRAELKLLARTLAVSLEASSETRTRDVSSPMKSRPLVARQVDPDIRNEAGPAPRAPRIWPEGPAGEGPASEGEEDK